MKATIKTILSSTIRRSGLIRLADKLRFVVLYLKSSSKRKAFKRDNPSVVLPPAYLIYESFDMNYQTYYHASRETARWLLEKAGKHVEFRNINILDWGCGPARIVRHLPAMVSSCQIFGTDYNARTIAWCQKSITNISFNLNGVNPPLPYSDSFFGFIYGISIFTHLPEELHYAWFNELVRISQHHGIIFLTLHGDAFRPKLTSEEQKRYDEGKLIVKGHTKIGHRTYAAFQPDAFVHQLAAGHTVVEHTKGGIINGKPQQDIWLIRVEKPRDAKQ